MKKLLLIFFISISIFQISFSQTPHVKFNALPGIDNMPDKFVSAIYRDSYGYMWFGSMNGLVRYDGYRCKVFRTISGDSSSLQDAAVSKILEDKQGNLWLQGNEGITKYTRKTSTFKLYKPKGFQDNNYGSLILSYALDSADNILGLLATRKIYYLNSKTGDFSPIKILNDSLPIIYTQFQCTKNSYWIPTANGLWKYNIKTKELKSYFHSKNKKDSCEITNLKIDKYGNIWAAISKGRVRKLNPETGEFIEFQFKPPAVRDASIQYIFINISNDGTVWIQSADEIGFLNQQTGQFNHYPIPNSITNLGFVKEDENNNFWFRGLDPSTENVFPFSFNLKTAVFNFYKPDLNSQGSFPSSQFLTFISDKEKNLWFGDNFGNGVSIYNALDDRYTFKSLRNKLDIKSFSFLCSEIDNVLWTGTWRYGGKVISYDLKSGKLEEYVLNEDYRNCFAIKKSTSGEYWVSTTDGLKKINRKTHKLEYFSIPSDTLQALGKIFISLFADSHDNIWFQYEQGLACLHSENGSEGKNWKIEYIKLRDYKKTTSSLAYNAAFCEDKDGNIWVGCTWGLFKIDYKTKAVQEYKIPELTVNDFFTINIDKKGLLWIGAQADGLFHYNPSTKRAIRIFNNNIGNLPSDIAEIYESNQDSIYWIMSYFKIFRFNNITYSYREVMDAEPIFKERPMYKASFYITKNNDLYWINKEGIRKLNLDSIPFDTIPPEPRVVGIKLFDKELMPGNDSILKTNIENTAEITFLYNQNFISIEYSGMHYYKSEKVQYEYMLEGLENDWQKAGNRTMVQYPGLQPGNYTFRLKAQNADGVWSKKEYQLKITILPPWWQTWWFRIIEILALLLSITLIIQWRLNRIKIEKRKLERKVKERTIQLNETNEELKQTNEELKSTVEVVNNQKEEIKSTLEHLKLTQAELIQSEKMASLGQLIAGIAHEINTPLGAINASITTITDSTQQSIKLLPELVKSLSDRELKLFMVFVNRSVTNNNLLSSKEERDCRRKLASQLEEKGIAEAEDFADILVDMGIYEDFENYLPLFKAKTLQAAYHLSMQIKNSQNIKMAVDRASKVVFALKNYARYGNEESMALANIVDGLETVLTLYQNQLKHGINLRKEFEEVPQILCYPDELNQVWTNLIHNAIQAMEGIGELSISVSKNPKNAKNPTVSFSDPSVFEELDTKNPKGGSLSLSKCNLWVLQVRITDTGKGIPPEIKGRIFDAFFTTKPAGEGAGLGLYIVKQIIDKHKGIITVESEVGKGTTFFVELPQNNKMHD